MVMHARKLPRITDGFSDKHQAHGYENSKYSNKYRYNNHDKNRDSPSTNSLRSSSPDSHSQSPRYHKSNYYTKVRDKDRDRENRERERDRDREREYKEYREREGSRSPKERRREIRERERDHRDSRGIHERINSVHKKDEKERLMRVGDWSEHVSSSGKKYYYNCRTEVSQWEKPPEWLEWERSHRGSGSSAPSSGNHSCKESSLSSVGLHRNQHDKNRQEKHSTLGLGDGYRESRDLREPERERREFRIEDSYDRRENRKYVQDVGTTDMDISSGDSTPTSESHHARISAEGGRDDGIGNSHISSTINQHLGSSDHFSRPMSKFSNMSNLGPLPTSMPASLPGSGSAITTLTGTSNNHHADENIKISSGSSNALGNSVSSAVPQVLNSHPRLMNLSNTSMSLDAKVGVIGHMNASSSAAYMQESGNNINSRPQLEPLNIATNSNNIGAGPPTPTHSENQDGVDIRKIGSPNSCLNSLHSLVPSSSNSGSISLTPSLANYYKETLICHVQSWPSEPIEKQCQRLSEEAHTISSIIMTKVSADLKMARSMVRHAEILSMLQEQRILFLRSQKSNLEEMKSHNCFMNDT